MAANSLRYVVLEGMPGVGKSTQIEYLQLALRKRGITPILLEEPTYSRYGLRARGVVAEGSHATSDREVEALRQDRTDHVLRKVRPLLEFVGNHDDFLLVQDRSYLSSPVFQGEGDPARMRRLVEEERLIAEPADLTIVLDVPVSVATERIERRKKIPSRFESPDWLERARLRFLDLKRWVSETIAIVDASGDPASVTRQILAALESHGLTTAEGESAK